MKRSEEEEDTLARSTKKFKDSHRSHETIENGMGSKMGSYKEKLVGAIPGAFAQVFGFDSSMQEDLESDNEEVNDQDGSIRIGFTKEEKARMRAPWQKVLIIKTFGRRMAFPFLVERVQKMWNSCDGMDCIDLGYDYFLVKFKLPEDVDSILTGGPWFIGQHFLAIRQWDPEFKASTATLTSIAVWIRLLELPIKFYESSAPLKIGRAIGPVLRIDSHTANGERGRFARLCVQVNLDKPLVRKLYLSKLAQNVLYEGINTLCFSCGRIGHKIETCPYTIREQPKEQSMDRSDEHTEMQNAQGVDGLKEKEKSQLEYGEWMVVNRRKNNNRTWSMQRAQVMSQTADVQLTQASIATIPEPSVAGQNRRDGKRKTLHTQPVVSQKETNMMGMSNLNQPKIGKSAKSKGVRAKTNQKATNSVGLQPNGVGPSNKSGILVFGSKVEQGLCGSLDYFNSKVNPKDNLISTGKENIVSEHYSSSDGRQGELGDLLQGEGDFGERRNNTVDKARSNGSVGLVRNRFDGGVEEPVPFNGEKQPVGLTTIEGRSVGHNSEPMMEILDGLTCNLGASDDKLRAISDRIRHAKLGKISVRSKGGVDEANDFNKEDVDHQTSGMFIDGQSTQGEKDSICRA